MEIALPCFDPFKIAASGQCFRMNAVGSRTVVALAGNRRLVIKALDEGVSGSRFQLDCDKVVWDSFWKRYFDLDTDYELIEADACDRDATLRSAAQGCHGLRILRQEPWETLICFLISQRKSIKAIKTCVKHLCERFGDACETNGAHYHAFPTPAQLADATEDELRACGVGYRAPYLLDAARRVQSGALPLESLSSLDNSELLLALTEVHGVGVKVASCVMLFGFHRMDVSPVDVWISRVIAECYGGVSPFEAYGQNAGVFQQYLFFSKVYKGAEG